MPDYKSADEEDEPLQLNLRPRSPTPEEEVEPVLTKNQEARRRKLLSKRRKREEAAAAGADAGEGQVVAREITPATVKTLETRIRQKAAKAKKRAYDWEEPYKGPKK